MLTQWIYGFLQYEAWLSIYSKGSACLLSNFWLAFYVRILVSFSVFQFSCLVISKFSTFVVMCCPEKKGYTYMNIVVNPCGNNCLCLFFMWGEIMQYFVMLLCITWDVILFSILSMIRYVLECSCLGEPPIFFSSHCHFTITGQVKRTIKRPQCKGKYLVIYPHSRSLINERTAFTCN